MQRGLVFVSLSCFVASLMGCVAGRAVTTQSLLAEMTDLRGMAESPQPAYTCKQASSYDRASTTPDDAKTWFANLDTGQYIREEQRAGHTEYVMMEADGPGAIVRIWSANPHGMLRIYLDNDPTPALEVPMADFLGGHVKGVPAPIACVCSSGWSSYMPIPYAKHCKVTGDEIYMKDDQGREHRIYYHVNYRTYRRGTPVERFFPEQLDALATEIGRTAKALADPKSAAGPSRDVHGDAFKPDVHGSIAPGETHEWKSAGTDGGAIVGFSLQIEVEDVQAALRHVVLTMEFDGEATVACPLGDFFGTSPGANKYASLPLGISDDGTMWCHWYMPFAKSARISFENRGKQPVELRYRVVEEDHTWTDRSMLFHAKWHGQHDVPTRPMQDWNYMTAEGQGVFAGVAFMILNPSKMWWGEGDEKIYVDGETFPSHFGTGTEDYYGYAWGSNQKFEHAYHDQPRCDGPESWGYTSVNRWDILDRIPFTESFKFDMELWHWDPKVNVDLAVVTYWYARPGGTDGFAPIEDGDLRLTDLGEYKPPHVDGAIEGETMRVIESTAGAVEPQGWADLSGEKHLWWRDAKPGDRLVLGFPVKSAGHYRVIGRFLTAADYGIHELSIDDKPVGKTIDLYHDGVAPSAEMDLGTFDLTAGENRIGVEITGANKAAVAGYMFGLDYLRLEPVTK